MVEHCVSRAKGCGFDSQGTHVLMKTCTVWMYCKSLWMKASDKCVNVMIYIYIFDGLRVRTFPTMQSRNALQSQSLSLKFRPVNFSTCRVYRTLKVLSPITGIFCSHYRSSAKIIVMTGGRLISYDLSLILSESAGSFISVELNRRLIFMTQIPVQYGYFLFSTAKKMFCQVCLEQ